MPHITSHAVMDCGILGNQVVHYTAYVVDDSTQTRVLSAEIDHLNVTHLANESPAFLDRVWEDAHDWKR